RGVAPDVRRGADEPDLDRHARTPQEPRHDEAVAAVVAAPAHDDDRPARAAEPLAQHARGTGAGALHEDVSRGAVLDGPPIERAHLGRGDGDHEGGIPAIALRISRTAASIPTSTARATRLWPMLSSTIPGS